MHVPRAREVVGVREPNIVALVVGKVEVVAAQRIGQPVGHLDERGTLDVVAHAVVHVRTDDRIVGETSDRNVKPNGAAVLGAVGASLRRHRFAAATEDGESHREQGHRDSEGWGSMNGRCMHKHSGSSHKCMHDFAPGRSATAVGRRCGCARAGTQRCSRLSLSRRAPARAPLLVGGPARRQPDQTQAADAMALTWRRTEKASGRGLDFRRRSTLEPNPSLTVQPPWNWQPRHDSAGWCGRIFREPATPPQIQTVLVGHVSH